MDETPLQKWQREEVAKKAAFRLSHPNHRLITRGSRKGQIVRLTKADRRKERRVEQDRHKSEAPPVLPVTSINTKTATKTRELSNYKLLLVWLGICALSVGSYFAALEIAKDLQFLNLLPLFFPLIFADFIVWRLVAKPPQRAKYLPILWWIFGRSYR